MKSNVENNNDKRQGVWYARGDARKKGFSEKPKQSELISVTKRIIAEDFEEFIKESGEEEAFYFLSKIIEKEYICTYNPKEVRITVRAVAEKFACAIAQKQIEAIEGVRKIDSQSLEQLKKDAELLETMIKSAKGKAEKKKFEDVLEEYKKEIESRAEAVKEDEVGKAIEEVGKVENQSEKVEGKEAQTIEAEVQNAEAENKEAQTTEAEVQNAEAENKEVKNEKIESEELKSKEAQNEEAENKKMKDEKAEIEEVQNKGTKNKEAEIAESESQKEDKKDEDNSEEIKKKAIEKERMEKAKEVLYYQTVENFTNNFRFLVDDPIFYYALNGGSIKEKFKNYEDYSRFQNIVNIVKLRMEKVNGNEEMAINGILADVSNKKYILRPADKKILTERIKVIKLERESIER